jgi:hypothetical protein
MKWRVVIQRNGRSRKEQEQQVVDAELDDLPRLIGDPKKILYVQLAPEGGLFSRWREEKKC